MKEELITPCGMNCRVCSTYLAFENNLKEKGIQIPYCKGCRPRNKNCALLKKRCIKLSNNEVHYCYECIDFPCKNLMTIDKRYRERYRMSLIENLQLVKRDGINLFLSYEELKWRCPQCGGIISCHNGICFTCDFDKLNKVKSWYSWED
jgi:hypothetical protein